MQVEADDGIEYIPTYRPKDETKEEKKARKGLVKEARRVSTISSWSQFVQHLLISNFHLFSRNSQIPSRSIPLVGRG